jgi:uncharacterized protein (DUF169 family)
MQNLNRISESLTTSLDLKQPPIAVLLAEAMPAGVANWTGSAPAGCRFWQEAARGVFATSARDHDLCAIGIYTHHLDAPAPVQNELGEALKVFGELGYVRPEDIPQIPVLAKQPKYVIYGPLAQMQAAPDVVLLFVNASQTLIVSEAAQQIEAGLPPAMGRPACAVIPQAVNSGRAALSLGCCGARAYLDILTDDVALFAIPGPRIEAFADRIAALSNANGILSKFHTIRRADVESGGRPTVKQSLEKLSAANER